MSASRPRDHFIVKSLGAAWPARFATSTTLVILLAVMSGGSAGAGQVIPSNELDSTFGRGGIVRTNLPSPSETIWRMALQRDGSIVAMGWRNFSDSVVLRYRPDGDLDPTFQHTAHPFSAVAMAVQPDQKVVIGGTPVELNFVVDRVNADGTVDRSFGYGGEVTTQFPVAAVLEALTVQPDGKVIAAGEVVDGRHDGFALARYLPNGRLDHSFGSGGLERIRVMAGSHTAAGVAVQSDGKIVVSGHVSDNPTLLAMVRLQEDGSLDTTFGDGGVVIMTEVVNFTTASLALQPDGGILSSGVWYTQSTGWEFGLVRHRPDGTLDTAFGEGGLAHLYVNGLGSWPLDLAVQPNGLIVQVGYSPDEGDEQELDVVWWNPDGSLYSELTSNLFGFTSSATAVVIQDGKAVVGGSGWLSYEDQRFGLARFLST
jgi:uncharacterized delta-60 repeat protein